MLTSNHKGKANNNWLHHKNKVLSSPSLHHESRLCLVCGEHFSKAALPSHYKSCVRRHVGKPARLSPLSLDSLNIDSKKRQKEEASKTSKPKHDSKNSSLETVAKPVNEKKYQNDFHEEPSEEYPVQRHRPARLPKPLPPRQENEHSDADIHPLEAPVKVVKKKPKRKTKQTEVQTSKPSRPKHSPPPPPVEHDSEAEGRFEQEYHSSHEAPIQEYSSSVHPSPSPDPEEEYRPHETLLPCHHCTRSFAPDRLEKHEQACGKLASKKRKVFDATKARVRGTELEKYVVSGKKGAAVPSRPMKKKSNWRAKHEEFLRMVRQGRGETAEETPPEVVPNPDYVLCKYCDRRFNELAAERHIPICRESKRKAELRSGANGPANGTSAERKKRMSYNPRKASMSPRK